MLSKYQIFMNNVYERHRLAHMPSTFYPKIKMNAIMEPKETDLIKLQSKTFRLDRNCNKSSATDVFAERRSYLNEFTFFLAYFNVIPNYVNEIGINCKKAHQWFIKAYKQEIKDVYFDKRYYNNSKIAEFDDIFYILYDDLLLHFDTNCDTIKFLFRNTDFAKIEIIINEIKSFKTRKVRGKPKISLLINTSHGIDTKSFGITKPKLSIENNYNDDFQPIHQTIIKRLNKKNDKGLVLLHGKPGTGKTNYIRYLISSVRKNVIFLPPNMANSITSPSLMGALISNANSVFVIEDAENIVMDREKDGCSPVSALLNISDGLLSDCLNIQIICSFNTDLAKVDSALLRKGRLIAKYEFKELAQVKAQALSQKLGFSTSITSSMTLTDIYNQEEKDFQQQKKRHAIGFKACEAN